MISSWCRQSDPDRPLGKPTDLVKRELTTILLWIFALQLS